MSARLRWNVPDGPPPKHPYRDTLVVYGGLSLVLVLVAWVTGGSVGKAVAVAILFFVAAAGWTMMRFRTRLREQAARREEP